MLLLIILLVGTVVSLLCVYNDAQRGLALCGVDLVWWLCLFIYVGLDYEGIFRVSGSARVIERLKMLYEVNDGDVEFDDERDITDITGLLKLFLRELPDSVIPTDVAEQFLQLQAS